MNDSFATLLARVPRWIVQNQVILFAASAVISVPNIIYLGFIYSFGTIVSGLSDSVLFVGFIFQLLANILLSSVYAAFVMGIILTLVSFVPVGWLKSSRVRKAYRLVARSVFPRALCFGLFFSFTYLGFNFIFTNIVAGLITVVLVEFHFSLLRRRNKEKLTRDETFEQDSNVFRKKLEDIQDELMRVKNGKADADAALAKADELETETRVLEQRGKLIISNLKGETKVLERKIRHGKRAIELNKKALILIAIVLPFLIGGGRAEQIKQSNAVIVEYSSIDRVSELTVALIGQTDDHLLVYAPSSEETMAFPLSSVALYPNESD